MLRGKAPRATKVSKAGRATATAMLTSRTADLWLTLEQAGGGGGGGGGGGRSGGRRGGRSLLFLGCLTS